MAVSGRAAGAEAGPSPARAAIPAERAYGRGRKFHPSMFKLLRYFSLTSAVAILSVTVVLVVLYRHNAVNDLVEIAERQNVALGRSFANTIWPRFSTYVTGVSGLDGDALRARPETRQIHDALKAISAGLPVLKVKIYNLDGLTVFSSQASQIGEDKSNNPGFFASAREGRPASKQAHKHRFSIFSGDVVDRHLVESYLPIRRGDGPVEGVFELYSDVTPLIAKIERSTSRLAIGLVLVFGTLYAVLFLIVRRADRILKRQYIDLRHVTAEVQRQAEQLAQALEKEQELNALQREFVALASHEFRTPLTIIDLAAQRLVGRKDKVTPEDLVARTDKIRAAVRRMTGLIESTLYASRLDAGTIAVKRQACDLKGLIREVCARQAEISQFHDIRVDVAGLPENIHADPKLLDQVFTNLLSNAVKYAPDDSRIEVKGWTDGDFAAMSVRDHGVGIAADDLPRLCERFFRARTSAGIGGTGLGLNLVKQLVELHKGTIEVDSIEGQGSVFTVRLPVDLRAAGAPAQGTGDRATPMLAAVKGALAT